MGSSGSLFGITDNLSGSLSSVNDVSGLPILEVFSDDRVVMGRFNSNALIVSGSQVGIGKAPQNGTLDVSGSIVVSGSISMTQLTASNASISITTGSSLKLTSDLTVAGLIVGQSYVSANNGFPRMDLWGASANLPNLTFAANTGIRFNVSGNAFEHLVGNSTAMTIGPGGVSASFANITQVTGSVFGTSSWASQINWAGVNETVADTFIGTASFSTNALTYSSSLTATNVAQSGSVGVGLTNLVVASASLSTRVTVDSASLLSVSASFVAASSSFSGRIVALSSSFNSTQISASIISGSQITGSLFGTSSFALTASYALSAVASLPANVVSASQQLTNGQGTALTSVSNITVGQLSGSIVNSPQITGSLFGTSSFAINAQTYSSSLSVTDTTNSSSFTTTINALSASAGIGLTNLIVASSSFSTRVSTLEVASGSFSTRITVDSSSLLAVSASFIPVSSSFVLSSGSFSSRLVSLSASFNTVQLTASVAMISASVSIGTISASLDPIAPERLLIVAGQNNSYNMIVAKTDTPNYAQIDMWNFNGGVSASADLVASNNSGSQVGGYTNVGINGEGYNQPNNKNGVGNAADGYVYHTGSNFFVGNTSPNKNMVLFVGGATGSTLFQKMLFSPTNFHQFTGSLSLSGSLAIVGQAAQLTASIISGSQITGSFFGTASFATNAQTYSSSLSTTDTTTSASFTTTINALSASVGTGLTNLVVGSSSFSTRVTTLEVASGSFSTRITVDSSSLLSVSSSLVSISSSYVISSGSFSSRFQPNIVSSSNQLTNGQGTAFTSTSNVTHGQITASALNTATILASGSNRFGSSSSSYHEFTGSINISGSAAVAGLYCSGSVTALGDNGFSIFTYAINARNPIFYSVSAFQTGISFFHGTSGYSGSESIGFHFGTATALSSILNVRSTGINVAGYIADTSGLVRAIPQNSQTTSYTLVATDAGRHINITTGGVTIPASVFSVGDNVTIFNNSGVTQTITQGASVTLRQAGTANTGNRTLAVYGLCSILCIVGGATPTFTITGTIT
jgi:hypothetical protein